MENKLFAVIDTLPVLYLNSLSKRSWRIVIFTPILHLITSSSLVIRWFSNIYENMFESRFPLQTPRSPAGRFCLGAGDNVFPGGWEPQILYILDNLTLPKQQVPDLTFFWGVGNRAVYNTLLINYLQIAVCQTCVSSWKKFTNRRQAVSFCDFDKSLYLCIEIINRDTDG